MSSVKLDSKTVSYDQLEKDYRGFIAPAFKVLINNEDAAKKGMAIDSVTIQSSTSESADTASFNVTNAYDLIERDFKWTKPNSLLQLGNTIEVFVGYTDQLTSLFFGFISNIEFNFSSGQAPTISVTATDISFFMMRNGEPDVWSNKTIADIVEEIGRKYGLTEFDIAKEDKYVYPSIAKNNESDHEFLQALADDYDYEFFVVGKKLYFRPFEYSAPVMKLEYGKNLMSFRIVHDIADQVTKVVVKGSINNTKDTVYAEATRIEKIGHNSLTGSDLMKKVGNFIEVLQETVKDEAQAKQLAESKMQERSMKLVTASASCLGLPEIRAGRYIEIGGLGERLNSIYFIESTTHTVDASGYQTSFNLQGNAV